MSSTLFAIPLKHGKLEEYLSFAKETELRAKEYSDMLQRYDIHSAKIWQTKIGYADYIFVYHDVGPDFQEKMKSWDVSDHPFDKWFRESIHNVYDIQSLNSFKPPVEVLDFQC